MSQVAVETLDDDVDYRLSEYSGCEDTGRAGDAAAIADVPSWRHRNAASHYLAGEAWIRQDVTIFRSPDGDHEAHIVMTKEEGIPRHAAIYFKHND